MYIALYRSVNEATRCGR